MSSSSSSSSSSRKSSSKVGVNNRQEMDQLMQQRCRQQQQQQPLTGNTNCCRLRNCPTISTARRRCRAHWRQTAPAGSAATKTRQQRRRQQRDEECPMMRRSPVDRCYATAAVESNCNCSPMFHNHQVDQVNERRSWKYSKVVYILTFILIASELSVNIGSCQSLLLLPERRSLNANSNANGNNSQTQTTNITMTMRDKLAVVVLPIHSTRSCQQCLPADSQSAPTQTLPPPTNLSTSSPTTIDHQAPVNVDATPGADSNNNTTILNSLESDGHNDTTTTTATNRLLLQQQQHNSFTVLCNSRCNCVILEPLLVNGQQQQQQSLANLDQTGTANATQTDRQPLISTNNSSQQRVELALIAFNEDYSLDYEAPSATGSWLQDDSASAATNGAAGETGTPVYVAPAALANSSSSSAAAAAAAAAATTTPPTASLESTTRSPQAPVAHLTRQAHLQEHELSTSNATQTAKTVSPRLFTMPNHHHLRHHHHHQQPSLAVYLPTADSSSSGGSSGGQSALKAPPVVKQTPYVYHHARSIYLTHHLRQLQLASSDNSWTQPNAAAANQQLSGGHQLTQRSLVPLRVLDMSNKLANQTQHMMTNSTGANQVNINGVEESPQLIQALEAMLLNIERNQIQSLVLRNNELQFELWSELYALLALPARQHLFHLDLSHNELSKLGATFTGFIEHHLAAYGQWPVNASDVKLAAAKSAKASQRLRHNLFAAGRLFALVQQRIDGGHSAINLNGSTTTDNNNNNNNNNNISASLTNLNTYSYKHNATSLQLLQQPMLIRALDLSHNKLKWLIKDQFRALKHVQTIRLDYNRIRYIHEHAFNQLQSLRFLNLNFNRLQVIYVEQFQTNYNLLALMLRSNYLAYLRGGSFASLANLKRLDLSRNKLTILSNNAFVGLESLELLNCSFNQFVHAPSASLHPLTSLRKLDLSANLIAQLAPGTFFHLPLEELWLNQNEQLVAIDRGAFWDLPYLRHLHIRSNPMLMSVNSQAFVGTQSLQTIDAADCQSLDESGQQILDNVTMTTASRQQRLEQQQQQSNDLPISLSPVNAINGSSGSSSSEQQIWNGKQQDLLRQQTESESEQRIQAQLELAESSKQLIANQNEVHKILEMHTGKLKYFYYLASIAFLAVLLKLVFKYTSTSHYLGANRRRRRRVYQAKGSSGVEEEPSELSSDFGCGDDSDIGAASSLAAGNVFPMCTQQPDGLLSVLVNGSSSNNQQAQQQQQQSHEDLRSLSSHSGESGASHTPSLSDSAHSSNCHLSPEEEQQAVLTDSNSNYEISVISEAVVPLTLAGCCPDCPQVGEPEIMCCPEVSAAVASTSSSSSLSPSSSVEQQQASIANSQQHNHSHLDLIHSQLIAAGYDYGHANCAHFYQSLGPALQLADMTANFVNTMEHYYS